jgi:protoporphyrinogen oxidase
MIPYNRKFWRYDLSRMTCEWLEGFVPVPTVKQVLERASSGTIGYNSTFFYPRRGGIGVLPEALASGIKRVRAGARATRIDLAARKVYFSDGRCEQYDGLVSTLPLPELPRLITRMDRQTAGAFAALRWNSIYNLNAGFSVPENGSRHWVYFPGRGFPFYRVGFFSSFSTEMAPEGKSSAYIEVSYDRKRPPDVARLWEKAAAGLVSCGMIRSVRDICLKDSLDIPYAYPIYDRKRPAALRAINAFLARQGISCCGRFGSWQYMTMEEAILDGKRAAEKIGDRSEFLRNSDPSPIFKK